MVPEYGAGGDQLPAEAVPKEDATPEQIKELLGSKIEAVKQELETCRISEATDPEQIRRLHLVGTAMMGCSDLPDYSPHRCCFGCHGYGDAYPQSQDPTELKFVRIPVLVEGAPNTRSYHVDGPSGIQPVSNKYYEKVFMPVILCCTQRRHAPSTLYRTYRPYSREEEPTDARNEPAPAGSDSSGS